jgi:hypothetical protein
MGCNFKAPSDADALDEGHSRVHSGPNRGQGRRDDALVVMA